jgi:colanic acid/amylovoran biosynthesis glycosyltransferase
MAAEGIGLVYVIGTYPLLTTTFIDREIELLHRLGADVRIFAMRRPAADTPLSSLQRSLSGAVTYLLPVDWSELLAAHVSYLLRSPRRYLGTLGYLLSRPHPSVRARFKTLLHFGEGVLAAHMVRRRPFEELHAHFADRAATIALVAGRLLAKPYTLSIHAGADVFADPILLREKVAEARHVVACTATVKGQVAAIAGAGLGRKISPIFHGLDLARYIPGRGQESDPPVILAVGQLKERKGFGLLIRASRLLRDQGRRFRCRIVGEGPQRQELEELIRAASLEDLVELCGALPHEEVVEQYRRATLFVLPCIRTRNGDMDGIPNAVAEAMAMELPVVSTDLPAMRELVSDGVNGVLVPEGHPAALAAAMGRLLDRPDLREAMGRQGRRTVRESFDVETNVRRLAETLWPRWFPALDVAS